MKKMFGIELTGLFHGPCFIRGSFYRRENRDLSNKRETVKKLEQNKKNLLEKSSFSLYLPFLSSTVGVNPVFRSHRRPSEIVVIWGMTERRERKQGMYEPPRAILRSPAKISYENDPLVRL